MTKSSNGYIYCIHQINSDFYKIGFTSKHPDKRLRELQTGNPHDLSVIWYRAVINVKQVECIIHDYLVKYKYRNEWFKISREDIFSVESLLDKFSM